MLGSSDSDSSSSADDEISISDDEIFSHVCVYPPSLSGSRSCVPKKICVPIDQLKCYMAHVGRDFKVGDKVNPKPDDIVFDCRTLVGNFISSPISNQSLPASFPHFKITSAEMENKAIKCFENGIQARWAEIKSHLNKSSSLAEFCPSPNYRFSNLSSNIDSVGMRLDDDSLVLHYDNFVAGLRPPFDPFFIECMCVLSALPCDFNPSAVRIIFAFIILCRLLGHEPSFSVFLQFYTFCRVTADRNEGSTSSLSVRFKKCRLFFKPSPKVSRWGERGMLVQSKVGWPFDKFGSLPQAPSTTNLILEDLSDTDKNLLNKLHNCLGWNEFSQKRTFSWRALIDISHPSSYIAGVPGPSFNKFSPCISMDFLKLNHHPAWYAACHHNICYPSDCETCHGVPSTNNIFILPSTTTGMEGNVHRESQLERLRAAKSKRDGLLSKQPIADSFLVIPMTDEVDTVTGEPFKVTETLTGEKPISVSPFKASSPVTRGQKRASRENQSKIAEKNSVSPGDGVANSTIGSQLMRSEKLILDEFTQVKSMILEVENKANEAIKMRDNAIAEVARLQALLESKDGDLEESKMELKRKDNKLQHDQFTHTEEMQSLKMNYERKIQEANVRLQKMSLDAFDNGNYHAFRCMRAYGDFHPCQDDMVIWLSTPQDEPILRQYHSEIPYSDELLDEFRQKYAKRDPPTIWVPPPVKEDNLRAAMKAVDVASGMDIDVFEKVGPHSGADSRVVVDMTKCVSSVSDANGISSFEASSGFNAFGNFASSFGVASASPNSFRKTA